MRTVRNLTAALACAALLSVFGATTAGAQQSAKCEKLAKLAQHFEAKEAKRAQHPGAADARQRPRPNFEIKVARIEARAAKLRARCSG